VVYNFYPVVDYFDDMEVFDKVDDLVDDRVYEGLSLPTPLAQPSATISLLPTSATETLKRFLTFSEAFADLPLILQGLAVSWIRGLCRRHRLP
jgi:hypothetical protein